MRGSLWWQMLRIGRAAGRAAEGGRARSVALLCAVAVLVLAGSAFVATSATYDARQVRADAREPVPAARPADVRARWTSYWDSYQGRQFYVVAVAPVTHDAPLPPGLTRWPAPGKVYLSPALRDGSPAEDFTHRYGQVAGTIGESGLASPGERLAYVRPTDAMAASTDGWVGISGYGRHEEGGFGDLTIIRPAGQLLAMIAVLFAGPALVLAGAAIRMGSAGRDRRAALVEALGAGRAARLWMEWGEAALPIGYGTVLGGLIVAASTVWNVRLPWIDYTLAAADMRQAWPRLVAAVLLAPLLTLALVVVLRPLRRAKSASTRPGSHRGGLLRLLCVGMCPAFALLAWFSGTLFAGNSLAAPVYCAATLGVLVTLPGLLAWWGTRAARPLAERARRNGGGAGLVAARRAAARPGAAVRLVTALVVAIGVVGQTQILSSMTSNRSGNLTLLHSPRSRTMLILQASPSARLGPEFRAALPSGTHVVSLGPGPAGHRIVQAPCPDLKALRLDCPAAGHSQDVAYGYLDARLRQVSYQWYGPTPATVRTGDLTKLGSEGTLWLAVFTDENRQMDISRVKGAIHQRLDLTASVRTLGEAGGTSFELGYQARWLTFFGAAGALALLTAMGLAAFSEFLRFGTAMAPLSVLSGNTRFVRRTALWSLGVPVLLAGVAGVLLEAFLAIPATNGEQSAEWPVTLYGVMLAASLAMAALITWAGGSMAVRSARRWTPRAD
ncbi:MULTISPECIES: hypothetical protein [Streptomycetaceae]|uniref:hypothetical protein n=1 Tax=Streptomycetaceae TaxID=2062 RepID=UPI000213FCB9|nr:MULTISPECIES: hypothetical protein [Streptomycetaceae]MYS60619.1 hypothetical protein [Streptomyces sp. SID5468]CCB76425.1 conserved membrane protein of unknown function [Streptantibioticus cattleyicolor NRRL 8057 = DSM 46488]